METDLNKVLFQALKDEDKRAIMEALQKGADINAKDNDNDGWTTLMYASGIGYLDIAELIIAKGVDVNAKDKDGKTALMFASEEGNLDVANLLIEKGADVNAKHIDGKTALMYAKSKDMISLLKKAGAI
jgi:ankyrin repeat protein